MCVLVCVVPQSFPPRHVEVGEGLCWAVLGCGPGPVRGGPLAWWWHLGRFGNRNWCIRRRPTRSLPLSQGMSLHEEPRFPILVWASLCHTSTNTNRTLFGNRGSGRALQVAGCGCSVALGSVSSGSAEMTAFALSRFKRSLNAAGPLIAEQSDCPYLRHRGDQGTSRHVVPRRGRGRRIRSTRMCLVTRRIGASLGYRRLLSPKKRKRKDCGQGTLR